MSDEGRRPGSERLDQGLALAVGMIGLIRANGLDLDLDLDVFLAAARSRGVDRARQQLPLPSNSLQPRATFRETTRRRVRRLTPDATRVGTLSSLATSANTDRTL